MNAWALLKRCGAIVSLLFLFHGTGISMYQRIAKNAYSKSSPYKRFYSKKGKYYKNVFKLSKSEFYKLQMLQALHNPFARFLIAGIIIGGAKYIYDEYKDSEISPEDIELLEEIRMINDK